VRRQTPFGTARGSSATWPNERGFVGGTNDPTGLVQLGARAYDPQIGRFLSADPVLDAGNPQSLQGYAYADNSPISRADPSGLRTEDEYYGPGNSAQLESKQNTRKVIAHTTSKGGQAWHGFTNGLRRFFVDPFVSLYDEAVNIPKNAHDDGVAIREGRESWADAAGHAFDHTLKHAFDTLTILGLFNIVKDASGNLVSAGQKFAAGDIEGGVSDATVGILETASILGPVKEGFKPTRATGPTKAASGCHSFAPATPVRMADGKTKPIEQVKAGDTVLATDPVTGQTTRRAVTDLHRHMDQELTDVALADAAGNVSILHTTPGHRLWDETQHRWVEASALDVGDQLHTADGKPTRVAGLLTSSGPKPMYDLTIDTTHSFYVVAGATSVLVHNCGGDVALGTRADGLREFADSNGYTHYLDSPDWQADVRAAVNDPEVHLHIKLDGFEGATPAEKFANAYKNGSAGGYATEWEMYKVGLALRTGSRTWDSITFYENGKEMRFDQPDLPMPGR
jgi:RHS repeat-associated protein